MFECSFRVLAAIARVGERGAKLGGIGVNVLVRRRRRRTCHPRIVGKRIFDRTSAERGLIHVRAGERRARDGARHEVLVGVGVGQNDVHSWIIGCQSDSDAFHLQEHVFGGEVGPRNLHSDTVQSGGANAEGLVSAQFRIQNTII
jgi:hypothetical protein